MVEAIRTRNEEIMDLKDTTPPERGSSDTRISATFARGALAFERYVLPWIFAYLAYRWFVALQEQYAICQQDGLPGFWQPAQPRSGGLAWAALVKCFLIFLLMAFSGVTLFFARRPIALPTKLKHLLVPLAMSYFFLLYGFVDHSPQWLRENLLSPAFRFPASILGLVLSLVGYSLSIWALIHLGRSFAIFVSVRKVVSSGPYAYVRHPIYLGYVIDLCGLFLASFSIAMLILGAGFVALLVIRARIEEEMLRDTDEGYREYSKRTGFLIP